MSALVPHFRPLLEDGSIRAGEPVGALDWSTMGALANWINGHGKMLVPFCAIGQTITAGGSAVYNFRVVPSARAVERIWLVNLRAAATGGSVALTPNGGSAVTRYPVDSRDARTSALVVRQSLSAKSAAEATISMTVAPTGENVVVESIACYEQTRAVLAQDTTDYGVDLTSLRPRQPIADVDFKHVAGVCDAYKNIDARKAGLFFWGTSEAAAITPGAESDTDLFDFYPVIHAAIGNVGDTEALVTVAAYAKVSGGTGTVTFSSTDAGDSKALSITSTSFAWVTSTLLISTEDLSVADGRRGNAWETVRIQGADPSGQTLSIAAISIFRGTRPL